jgi:FkbM family methyltransferase
MKKKLLSFLKFILPSWIFNALIETNGRLERLFRFYMFSLKSILFGKMSTSILFFPVRGGSLGCSCNSSYPRKYWYTWEWLKEIEEYGAELQWENDDVTVSFKGAKLTAFAGDESIKTVFFEVFRDDEYHLNDYDLNGLSVIDVGANIGDSPVMFINRGAKNVIAFEPLPALKKYFDLNIAQNGMDHLVTMHNVGWSDKEEVLTIFMRAQGTAGTSAVLHSESKMDVKPGYMKQEIKLVNAIEYLETNNIGAIDVLKMDCEHCEYVVFKSPEMLEYLSPRYIFLEYHDGYRGLKAMFEKRNYVVKIYEKNERVGVLVACR